MTVEWPLTSSLMARHTRRALLPVAVAGCLFGCAAESRPVGIEAQHDCCQASITTVRSTSGAMISFNGSLSQTELRGVCRYPTLMKQKNANVVTTTYMPAGQHTSTDDPSTLSFRSIRPEPPALLLTFLAKAV